GGPSSGIQYARVWSSWGASILRRGEHSRYAVPVAAAAGQAGLGDRAGQGLAEVRQHQRHALRLRLDAQQGDAEVAQFRQLRREVDDVLALDLHAVDAQQRLALAGGQRHAAGAVDAAEAALVLGQVEGAGGAAARRPGQWRPAP